uniref:Uncharacterized protein n=1 Tax=Clavispora lusitaniae TaxID=36911 RepID=S5U5D0_CLALS|nr:hypothetical protein [Clavispora lusitaniae]AGS44301.1 hypothetical protein [Clavispora lusitaniae]
MEIYPLMVEIYPKRHIFIHLISMKFYFTYIYISPQGDIYIIQRKVYNTSKGKYTWYPYKVGDIRYMYSLDTSGRYIGKIKKFRYTSWLHQKWNHIDLLSFNMEYISLLRWDIN